MTSDLLKKLEDSFVEGAATAVNLGIPAGDVAKAMWRAVGRIRDLERDPVKSAQLAEEFKTMMRERLKPD